MGRLRLLFWLWFVFLFLRAVDHAEERKITNYNNEYSHKLLFLWLLDLLRFAFIQRGSVLFWMHVRPENERTLYYS